MPAISVKVVTTTADDAAGSKFIFFISIGTITPEKPATNKFRIIAPATSPERYISDFHRYVSTNNKAVTDNP